MNYKIDVIALKKHINLKGRLSEQTAFFRKRRIRRKMKNRNRKWSPHSDCG